MAKTHYTLAFIAMQQTKLFMLAGVLATSLTSQAALIVDGAVNNFSGTQSCDDVTVTNGGTLNLLGGALTVNQTSPNNNAEHFFLRNGSLLNFVGGVHTI